MFLIFSCYKLYLVESAELFKFVSLVSKGIFCDLSVLGGLAGEGV